MIIVKVEDAFASQVNDAKLELAAQTTLEHLKTSPEADLSIVVTGNDKIQALNWQYRGIDSATDVLSFPAGFTDPDTENIYLGDVIISFQKCQSQAHSANHPVNQELNLLVVHGVLHLLGHDHNQADEKQRMWSAQEEILKRLGYGDLSVPD